MKNKKIMWMAGTAIVSIFVLAVPVRGDLTANDCATGNDSRVVLGDGLGAGDAPPEPERMLLVGCWNGSLDEGDIDGFVWESHNGPNLLWFKPPVGQCMRLKYWLDDHPEIHQGTICQGIDEILVSEHTLRIIVSNSTGTYQIGLT